MHTCKWPLMINNKIFKKKMISQLSARIWPNNYKLYTFSMENFNADHKACFYFLPVTLPWVRVILHVKARVIFEYHPYPSINSWLLFIILWIWRPSGKSWLNKIHIKLRLTNFYMKLKMTLCSKYFFYWMMNLVCQNR